MSETPTKRELRQWGDYLLNGFTFLVYVFMFAPIIVVILLSFNSSEFGSFPIEGLSLRWFEKLLANEVIIRAFLTSASLGILTALIGTLVAMMSAMALVRYRVPGRKLFSSLTIAPLLIPETALAVGLLLLLRSLGLPRTYMLLLIGHVLITLPFAFLVIQARLSGLGRTYEEAASSLGANALTVFREITLPLTAPALVAALLFAFTISFDNLTASLFWRPNGIETVPTQIFAMLKDSVSPEINALGTVMVSITIGLSLLAGAIGSRLASQAAAGPDN
ncbi:ABC transporter permease [Roseovarius spongiae]|uniref:Spermidine/putrescine transport system permease protein PotC n=1 Tax=Roseovarius spongiae TaxID=2320272 RepID=A0A3A8AQH5_9RHOB|nr:ABC transporter permease [Roseovarius spongiae]RKF12687.1 ABC transporter permease [Roseovarius spongiae]